jgi:hypothetical protein
VNIGSLAATIREIAYACAGTSEKGAFPGRQKQDVFAAASMVGLATIRQNVCRQWPQSSGRLQVASDRWYHARRAPMGMPSDGRRATSGVMLHFNAGKDFTTDLSEAASPAQTPGIPPGRTGFDATPG